MIAIIDYGLGNLGSILNMLKKIGIDGQITADPLKINDADKIILPGVGAFDKAMENLNGTELRKILDKKAMIDKVPVLGVCLGMQILGSGSEEGQLRGLGWISSFTYKFNFANSRIKVPHMSWNTVHLLKKNVLFGEIEIDPEFYFSHSYYVVAKNDEDVVGITEYGIRFHSVIQKENIYGAQFHPEKSHKYGMTLLKNFASL